MRFVLSPGRTPSACGWPGGSHQVAELRRGYPSRPDHPKRRGRGGPRRPSTSGPPDPGAGPEPEPRPVGRIRRFHGEVALSDPRRPIPELTKIVDEVIGRLAQQTDVRLHVTVQVEAEHAAEAGFTDDTVRTISENAKTLRFRDFGWEKE